MNEQEEKDLSSKLPSINKNKETAKKNTILILKTMKKYIDKNKKHPSITKISELTGLERHTVSKRLKKLTSDECLEPFKRYTQNMMQSAIKNGLSGDLKSIKFFFQAVWKLNENNTTEQLQNIERPIINITTTSPSPFEDGISFSNPN